MLHINISLEICYSTTHLFYHFVDIVNLYFETYVLYMILIYRDAVSDLALHFLSKMKILVVKDIEREEIEFVCKVSDSNKIVS